MCVIFIFSLERLTSLKNVLMYDVCVSGVVYAITIFHLKCIGTLQPLFILVVVRKMCILAQLVSLQDE